MISQERERMQNLKVHEKLSKAQRLMQGRRFRVLKEIDDDIEREVYSSPVATQESSFSVTSAWPE